MAIKVHNREVGDRQTKYMTSTQVPEYYNDVKLSGLNPKQKRFAQNYVSTVNVAEASRAVGYSESSGHRLLKRADVQAYIQWLVTEQANADIMSATEVLEELTKIGRREATDIVVTKDGLKVEKKIDVKDQISALQQLAKFHDLLTPDTQVNNEFNIVVNIEEPSSEEEGIKEAEIIEEADYTAIEAPEDDDVDYGFLNNY